MSRRIHLGADDECADGSCVMPVAAPDPEWGRVGLNTTGVAEDMAAWARSAAAPGAAGPTGQTGTSQYYPPAAASPRYSPPPTVRANWGVDWDAISRAFTSGIYGGAAFSAGPGNPASYYSATPAYLAQQQAAMSSAIQTSTDFQKTMSEQNARAAAAIMAAGASAVDLFGRPLPVVIDPTSDIFRLQLPGAAAAAGGGTSKWLLLAGLAAAGLVGWRWMQKRKRTASA